MGRTKTRVLSTLRSALRLVAPLVAALALGGCSDDTSEYFGTTARATALDPTTFYLNGGGDPEYLDPGMAHDSASASLILQMFEGLTTYSHGDMHPVQGAATSWDQSDDNRFYRFHLRPEGRWSDGKQVTAHDFAYAWRRALRPATASQAISNLYVVKNAEPFNLGKLKVTGRDLALKTGPSADSDDGARLAKGTAVLIVARSPMMVVTGIAPLAAVPPGSAFAEYDKATDELSLDQGKAVVKAAEGSAWKDAEVAVLDEGPQVECNGAPDHWYSIEKGGVRGYLPGCVLGPVKGKKGFVLVRRYDDLPTFTPVAEPPPPPPAAPVEPAEGGAAPPEAPPVVAPEPPKAEPPPTGFVDEADLVQDESVIGVRAKDDLTLEVELERPTPYFLDLTSYQTLFPVREDVVEPFRERGEPDMWTRPETIVTNGPYTLETWKFRYEITMKRNPFFRDFDKLKIHRIVAMQIEAYHATMNLYKAGDLDYMGDTTSLPPEYIPFLKTKRDYRRNFYLSTYWYELNTRKPPVDNPLVRRALNLSIDKQQLIDKVTQGGQLPATHYVPDFVGLGYAEAVKADRAAGTDPFSTPDTVFNPEGARALLAEAGYPIEKTDDGYRAKGFPSLEILYNTSEGHKAIAVAVQDMWKRHLGVSATLRNEEWKVMLKNVRDGNFQVVRFGWVGDFNHAHTWLDTFMSQSPNNRTGWASPEFDGMVRKAAATADPKDSIRLYREAEKVAVDAMAKIPLYFYTKQTLVKPWVLGFEGNARNIQLIKWLAIDPGRHERTDDVGPAIPDEEFPPPGRVAPQGAPCDPKEPAQEAAP